MKSLIQKLLAAGVMAGGVLVTSPLAIAQDGERAVDDEDRRTPVVLRPAERTRVLNDMRNYLRGLQEIFELLAKNDLDKVSARAKELGEINIYETHLMFPSRASVTFRELSSAVHDDFEAIASNSAKKDASAVLADISQTMKRCVACHAGYRLTEMAHYK